MKHDLKVLLLAVLLFSISACAAETPQPTSLPVEPQLSYEVGDCDESRGEIENLVDIQVQENTVQIDQQLSYLCEADLVLELEQEGEILRITERNTQDPTDCICGYEIEASITNLPPGQYTVQIWGVQTPEIHPLDLLGGQDITIE